MPFLATPCERTFGPLLTTEPGVARASHVSTRNSPRHSR
jgi:hypothetical protein